MHVMALHSLSATVETNADSIVDMTTSLIDYWDAGTAYSGGDQVVAGIENQVDAINALWTCISPAAAGEHPADYPALWDFVHYDPKDAWRVRDVNTLTSGDNSTTLYVQSTQVDGDADAIAVLNVTGGSVRCRVRNDADDAWIHDETINLTIDGAEERYLGTDAYAGVETLKTPYFSDVIFSGLPLLNGRKWRIDVATSNVPHLSMARSGSLYALGETNSVTFDFESYSSKDRDASGAADLFPGEYFDSAVYTFTVLRGEEQAMKSLLIATRDTDCVWIGALNRPEQTNTLYGFQKDHRRSLSGDNAHFWTVEVEQLR